MSTVDGLPAHILLNHVVVVLGPLAALLAMLCAVWPAVRSRLIWLVLVLSAVTLIVTPPTTSSGGWLADKVGNPPAVQHHGQLGDSLVYVIATLVAAVTMLAAVHLRQSRGRTVKSAVHVVVAVLVIAAATATLVQTYRVGESGARAAWGSVASQ